MNILDPKPDSSDVLTYTTVRIVVLVLLVLAFLYFTGDGNLRPDEPPFPADYGVHKQWVNAFGLYVAGAWLVAFVRDNSREYSNRTLAWLRVLGFVLGALAVGWRIWLFPR